MFESLKHWFDSLNSESQLFNNPEDEALHSALASVLYHIISVDKQESSKEKHEFSAILKQAFDLDEQQIDHLYAAARSSTTTLQADLKTVNHFLKQKPSIRMNFMKSLNHLICIDGVKDRELDIFFEELHQVFPNLESQ